MISNELAACFLVHEQCQAPPCLLLDCKLDSRNSSLCCYAAPFPCQCHVTRPKSDRTTERSSAIWIYSSCFKCWLTVHGHALRQYLWINKGRISGRMIHKSSLCWLIGWLTSFWSLPSTFYERPADLSDRCLLVAVGNQLNELCKQTVVIFHESNGVLGPTGLECIFLRRLAHLPSCSLAQTNNTNLEWPFMQ